jgi:hypothetical protein
MSFEFREIRSTHRIHIFDVDEGGRSRPICHTRVVGGMTYPLVLEDVEDRRVCRACLKRWG